MISVQVEKEIKQENRIFGAFTTRQAIVLGVSAVFTVLFYLLTGITIDALMYFSLPLGAAAYFLGFYKKNGLYAEYYLFKSLKGFIYHNDRRRYRSKNRYITMLNRAYQKDREEDLSDPKKKKYIKRNAGKRTRAGQKARRRAGRIS